MQRRAPQRRARDCTDVTELADRVERLARRCRPQSLKPVAVAARAAAELARSREAERAQAAWLWRSNIATATRCAKAARGAAARAAAEKWRAAVEAAKLRLDKAAAQVDAAFVKLTKRCAELEAIVDGPQNDAAGQHALDFSQAAMRIFRFAADSAPRVLQIAHVSALLRECAVDLGSADATLPGALRNDYAAKRFFKVRAVVQRNEARCWWLAAKILSCRSGVPVPAAALAPDVTRHDVNWGARGARRHPVMQPTHGGFGLTRYTTNRPLWAQGPVGVTTGKHYFQVCIVASVRGTVSYDAPLVGWVDGKISVTTEDWVSEHDTRCSGATCDARCGDFQVGTARPRGRQAGAAAGPADDTSDSDFLPLNQRLRLPFAVGCLLDLDATPARMTVFVDGQPAAKQCKYAFPKDGRAWFPSVSMRNEDQALFSCAI
jgi:hypothetical protein